MLKNPIPKEFFKKGKYRLIILKLKSAANNINPNSLNQEIRLH